MYIPKDIFQGWDILVVDDEPDSLTIASFMLIEYGANVRTACDGEEGLHVARAFGPHCIISDIDMPVMDGWDLLHALKSDFNLAHIPVIAFSASMLDADRQRSLEAGFESFLTKSLDPEAFIHNLIAVLSDIPSLAEALHW